MWLKDTVIEPWPKGRRRDAKTAACPVFLVRQESQERTANPANQDHLARPDSPVVLHWKFADPSPRRRANHAHQDPPVPAVPLANPVRPDPTATQATQAKMAAPDHLAHQARTDLPVPLARMERKDQPETQPPVQQLLPVMPAPPVKTEDPAQPEDQAHPVPMEDPAPLDPKDHPAPLDHPATMALQARRDPQAQTDPRENPAYARNTAPPMAVSSSKMEQGDKRFPRSPTTPLHFYPSYDIGSHFPRFNNFYPLIVILLASMSFAPSKQRSHPPIVL